MAADRINVQMGFTQNLGNFKSLRIDVGKESDRLEGETEDEHFKRVYDYVEEKFLAEFNETEKHVKDTNK